MRTISVSVDVEPDLYSKKYIGITEGLKKLEKLLNKRGIKATFFVTCDCIIKHPRVFQNLLKKGHEIALHGYTHKRFKDLTTKQKKEQIEKSIKCFEKYLKLKPKGFRAPQHAIDNETLDLLQQYGFIYDSSYSPWNFYHILFPKKIKINYSDNFKKKRIEKIRKNLYEVPIGTLVLPFSALTIRSTKTFALKKFLTLIKMSRNPVFMMHSWDLIPIKESKLYKKCPLECFLKKFEIFLDSFPPKKFKKIEELVPPVKT